MFSYIPLDPTFDFAHDIEMYHANFIIIHKTEMARQLLKWSVLCAVTRDCIQPDGAKFEGCDNTNARKDLPGSCHRFDQSILSVLINNLEMTMSREGSITLVHQSPYNHPIRREVAEQINTTKGIVGIKEIEAKVWEPLGYSLVSSSSHIIPVLKKKNPETCEKIFDDWQRIYDQGLIKHPPENLEPRDQFTLNGYARIMPCYMNQVFNNTHDSPVLMNHQVYWTKDNIEKNIAHGRAGNFTFIFKSYDDGMTVYHVTKYHEIAGKVGAVIGSMTPWVEVLCLLNGAKHLFTVDYQKVNVDHPNISFIQALDFVKGRDAYMNTFDFAMSFSSIEHSGLGRYGDPLDPVGDLREMEKVRCILKPGGLFYLGLPFGLDTTGFNCHRLYGRIRLAMLFAGFELINVFKPSEEKPHKMTLEELYVERGSDDYDHAVWVLRKIGD
ncbi:hypothetical protein Ddc_10801 [Ditylenchus destructor]|nr:hypothetical protein Ddc_10801 [Ditylenchus destructor]